MKTTLAISNPAIQNYVFLTSLKADPKYSQEIVNEAENILMDFSSKVEMYQPENLDHLYELSMECTDRLNGLAKKLSKSGKKFTKEARTNLTNDIQYIAKSYGYDDADAYELVVENEW